MPIGGQMLIWCEPIKRGDLKLAPGDVPDALTWFKETTGQDARLIVLNPKNERYAREVSNGVEFEYLGGCLAGEVWLSTRIVLLHAKPTFGAEDLGQNRCNEIMTRHILPVGRPSVDLPVEKVTELVAQGLGYRSIAKRLKAEGINLSHMAVSRAIKKLQGELPINET